MFYNESFVLELFEDSRIEVTVDETGNATELYQENSFHNTYPHNHYVKVRHELDLNNQSRYFRVTIYDLKNNEPEETLFKYFPEFHAYASPREQESYKAKR